MQVQPDLFKYYLIDSTGNYLSWVNNALVTSSVKTAINSAPDGWMDKSIQYVRNHRYYGINRVFTLPLRFVSDGAKILKSVFYNNSYEAVLTLSIEKNNTTDYQYEPYYTGEIDFSNFKDRLEFVEVNIIEGGLAKYLKANEATAYEIPLSTSEASLVSIDGLSFKDILNYQIESYTAKPHDTYVPLTFLNNEGTSIGTTYYSVNGSNGNPADYNSPNFFFKTLYPLKATFKFNFSFRVISSGAYVGLHLSTQTRSLTLITYAAHNEGGRHDYSFNKSWDLLAGEQVYLILQVSTGGSLVYIYPIPSFVVTYESKAAASTINALSTKYIFNYLINKITEGTCTVSSVFLDSLKDSVLISSGDGIRGLQGAVIKTSLSDFFKSIDSLYCIGLGEDTGIATIEKRAQYYLKTEEIVDIGEVKGVELSVENDAIYNTIKVGYTDQKYDERNGKDEFNTELKFSTPVKRIIKELDLTSPYRADMYGIEFLRTNLTGKKTTDSSSDNDNFFLSVVPDTTYGSSTNDISRTTATTLTGAYNEVHNVVFTGFYAPMTTIDNIVFTYTGITRMVTLGGSISITDTNSTGHKLIYIEQNASLITINMLDGSGSVNLPAYYVTLNNGDTIRMKILRQATGNFTINTAFMNIVFSVSTTYVLNRPAWNSISGLITPANAFNIEFSPKRNLLRHGEWLHSIYDNMDSLYIKFQTAAKNDELSTTLGSVTVTEKADELIGSLGVKTFQPKVVTVKTALPYNIIELVKANPYGYITFLWKGDKYKWFVLEITHKPSTREEQTIKLLSHPLNDLTKFVLAQ